MAIATGSTRPHSFPTTIPDGRNSLMQSMTDAKQETWSISFVTGGFDELWMMTTPNWSEQEEEFRKQNEASISLAITSLLIGKI